MKTYQTVLLSLFLIICIGQISSFGQKYNGFKPLAPGPSLILKANFPINKDGIDMGKVFFNEKIHLYAKNVGTSALTVKYVKMEGHFISSLKVQERTILPRDSLHITIGLGNSHFGSKKGSILFYCINHNPKIIRLNLKAFLTKFDQDISFSVQDKKFGDPPFKLKAKISTGLPIIYKSSNPKVVEIQGDMAFIKSPGEVFITAIQKGTLYHNGIIAPRLITVVKGVPVLEFSPSVVVRVDEPSFQLSTRSMTGLPVRFESSNPQIISVIGNVAKINDPGIVSITAIQQDNNYYEEVRVTREITVLPSFSKEISVFPFLAQDQVKVNIGHGVRKQSNVELKVFDDMGRLILSKKTDVTSSTLNLNVSHFHPGVYFIKWTQDRQLYTLKFMKR